VALRVLHLTGSTTTLELDDLSRLYARDCLGAVEDTARYEPLIAHVSPGGTWRFPDGLTDAEIAAAPPLRTSAALVMLGQLDIDVMVPHMFCLAGMTRYRALFDALGIPYIGNTPEAMGITARKDLARAVVSAAGVRVPAGIVVRGGDDGEVTRIGLPVVVKPLDADNSVGVTLVRDAGDYAAAIAEACEHGSAALVEQFIEPGREVRCGILERDGELLGLPLEEYPIDSIERPVRGAADKLARSDSGELKLVAKGGPHAWIVDPEDPVCGPVWAAARRAHRALDCRHYSLFDFRIDPLGRPWFLEAGLYCSFAPKSVIATMAEAAGTPVPELFATAVEAAIGQRLSGTSASHERSGR
jgi:D-alanine-D-alanine ligase